MNIFSIQPNSKPLPQVLSGHIYLIEDSADIRKHLSGVLERFGLTVESYENAESFLEQSVEVAPAVVLLDISLPGMNGLAAHKRLQQSGRKTPVIYMSGQSTPQEIIDALKMGANDFLWKPFSIDKLIAAVTKALEFDDERINKQVVTRHTENLWANLTVREKEVAILMVQGHGNTAIAKQFHVMPDTVKKHRAKVLEKMQVNTLAELVAQLKDKQLP